ncbi:hypothetical protein LB543_02390 [Mesorhizobium sp. ESP7-2]|uniref:hypothetical protein n=1 Tax=Mesorhizobium sp. ESP7-2 TaxID=2876622 RepID=UPI001CCFD6EC|nr:hypothetical protein [Mesorhizobium sp. ESP7-2]MBZ9705578.1 hypothetical protein [Mesorhizobium sp. ESP7-2]
MEFKHEDGRWASGVSGTTVMLLSAFIYAFFSQADASFATAFSRMFSLEVDLGLCSSSFASLIMAQIVYGLTVCFVLLGLMVAVGIAAILDPSNGVRYLKLLLAILAFLLVLLALAMKDNGFWLESVGRRLIMRHLSIADACSQSHNVDFIRIYIISACILFWTWILMSMGVSRFLAIYFHRDYDDLPKDPRFRAEILAIRANTTLADL